MTKTKKQQLMTQVMLTTISQQNQVRFQYETRKEKYYKTYIR